MSELSEFYLGSAASVVELDLIEISHSNFSKTYRKVRNKRDGVDVTIDGEVQSFEHYPLAIKENSSRADLDFGLTINLGDLGEIMATELDAVAEADGFSEKVKVRYWTYRSDDLTAPLYGPIVLEGTDFAYSSEGVLFQAKPPSANINGTGEVFSPQRFKALSSFL